MPFSPAHAYVNDEILTHTQLAASLADVAAYADGRILAAAPYLDVRDYGAVGNNSTDNASAFAAACAAANPTNNILTDGGPVIWVPPGIYRTSAAAPLRANCTLMGTGSRSIIRATGNNYCVAMSPGYRTRVTGLGFDAVSAQSSGGGIDFTGAWSKNYVDHVQCGDNLHTFFNIGINARSDFFFDHCCASSLTASGITGVQNCTYGFVVGAGGSQTNQIWIDHFSGTALPNSTSGMGTWVWARDADTFHITNSLFQCGEHGLWYSASSGYNSACKLNNVAIDGQNQTQLYLEQVRNFSGTNLQLTSLGGFTGAAEQGPCIWIKGTLSENVIIANSHIHGTPDMGGVKIESSNNTIIDGNTFTYLNQNGTGSPIITTAGAGVTDFTITNNSFRSNGGTQIVIPSGCNRYVVTGNRKDSTVSGAIISEPSPGATRYTGVSGQSANF